MYSGRKEGGNNWILNTWKNVWNEIKVTNLVNADVEVVNLITTYDDGQRASRSRFSIF